MCDECEECDVPEDDDDDDAVLGASSGREGSAALGMPPFGTRGAGGSLDMVATRPGRERHWWSVCWPGAART